MTYFFINLTGKNYNLFCTSLIFSDAKYISYVFGHDIHYLFCSLLKYEAKIIKMSDFIFFTHFYYNIHLYLTNS